MRNYEEIRGVGFSTARVVNSTPGHRDRYQRRLKRRPFDISSASTSSVRVWTADIETTLLLNRCLACLTGSSILVLKLTFSPDPFPRNLPLSLSLSNGLISRFLSCTCTEVSGVENIGQCGYSLINKTTELSERDYIVRVLYKYSY